MLVPTGGVPLEAREVKPPVQTVSAHKTSAYDYYVSGNTGDALAPTRPGVALMGGGGEVDEAFGWMVEGSGGGDFVVLRGSGADEYHEYLHGLGPLDSVETLVIHSREAASDPFVLERVRNAEAIYLAGGDQARYVTMWKDTPLEQAINEAATGGVPVGGSSAGLAVLGEFSFSARQGTITSDEAMGDPGHPRMSLDRDFLGLFSMQDVITDSHFSQRGRMGRLLAFMANIARSGWADPVKGVGVDEATAVVVDDTGMGRVLGEGSAYFMRAAGPPEVCEPGKPLTYRGVPGVRVDSGGHFDLARWSGEGGTPVRFSVVQGKLEPEP
ncbi:MAG: cyanophycinase [Armatimonadetes bacterium]|nr:cyanophycinase [Armatimonadota bacterium]